MDAANEPSGADGYTVYNLTTSKLDAVSKVVVGSPGVLCERPALPGAGASLAPCPTTGTWTQLADGSCYATTVTDASSPAQTCSAYAGGDARSAPVEPRSASSLLMTLVLIGSTADANFKRTVVGTLPVGSTGHAWLSDAEPVTANDGPLDFWGVGEPANLGAAGGERVEVTLSRSGLAYGVLAASGNVVGRPLVCSVPAPCRSKQQGSLEAYAGLAGMVSVPATNLSGATITVAESAVVAASSPAQARDVTRVCLACTTSTTAAFSDADTATFCNTGGQTPAAGANVSGYGPGIFEYGVCREGYSYPVSVSTLTACMAAALANRGAAEAANAPVSVTDPACRDVTVRIGGTATTAYSAGFPAAPASHTGDLSGMDVTINECASTAVNIGTLSVVVTPPFNGAQDVVCGIDSSTINACTGQVTVQVTCATTGPNAANFFFEAGVNQTAAPDSSVTGQADPSLNLVSSVDWQAAASSTTTFTIIVNDASGAAAGTVLDMSATYIAFAMVGCTSAACGPAYAASPYSVVVTATSMSAACPSFAQVERATHFVQSSFLPLSGFDLPEALAIDFDVYSRFSMAKVNTHSFASVEAAFTQTLDVNNAPVSGGAAHTATVAIPSGDVAYAFNPAPGTPSVLSVTLDASILDSADLRTNPGTYSVAVTVTTVLTLSAATSGSSGPDGGFSAARRLQTAPTSFAAVRRLQITPTSFAESAAAVVPAGTASVAGGAGGGAAAAAAGAGGLETSGGMDWLWQAALIGAGAACVVAAVAVIYRRRQLRAASLAAVHPKPIVPATA